MFIEEFKALDAEENEYSVTVNGIEHKSYTSGKLEIHKDYSLTETGEVLEINSENKRAFRIKSTNTLIIDIRILN